MTGLGATLIPTDTGDRFAYFDAEFTVLLYEFKVDIAGYLATLGHTSHADAGGSDRLQPARIARPR